MNLVIAFILGAAFCWFTVGFITRRVLRGRYSTTRKAIEGLPQESLIRTYNAASQEIEKRKRGIEEAGL